MTRRYRRKEFLKSIGLIAGGALAGSILSRVSEAYSIPIPEKIISPNTPLYGYDVVIYRDGDYAVAVDNKGRKIDASDEHADVLNNAIWSIVENYKRSPRLLVVDELIINKDIELPTIINDKDYRYNVIIHGLNTNKFNAEENSCIKLSQNVKITSKSSYWSFIEFRDITLIGLKGSYITSDYVIPFFNNVFIRLNGSKIQQNAYGPPGVIPEWRNMIVQLIVPDDSQNYTFIDVHFEGLNIININTIMSSLLTSDANINAIALLLRGTAPYNIIGLNNFVWASAEYVAGWSGWQLLRLQYNNLYTIHNLFSNVESSGFTKEPTIFILTFFTEEVMCEVYGIKHASYGHYLINWWSSKPKHLVIIPSSPITTKLSGTSSTTITGRYVLYKDASTDPNNPAIAYHMRYVIPAGTVLNAGVNTIKLYTTTLSGKSTIVVKAKFADPSDVQAIFIPQLGKDNSSNVSNELEIYVINTTGAQYTTIGDIEVLIDIEDLRPWQY